MKKMTWQHVVVWNWQVRRAFQTGRLSRQQIRILESKWWWKPELEDTVSRNKDKIIKMALNGGKRPPKTTKIGSSLINYTRKDSHCYCEKFDRNIRCLRPDWFVSISDRRLGKFREAVQWTIKNNRIPSSKSLDSQERSYAQQIIRARMVMNGKAIGNKSVEYHRICDSAGMPDLLVCRESAAISKAHECFRFCKKTGRLASTHSKCPEEKKWGKWISRRRSARSGFGSCVWMNEYADIAAEYGFPDAFDPQPNGGSFAYREKNGNRIKAARTKSNTKRTSALKDYIRTGVMR